MVALFSRAVGGAVEGGGGGSVAHVGDGEGSARAVAGQQSAEKIEVEVCRQEGLACVYKPRPHHPPAATPSCARPLSGCSRAEITAGPNRDNSRSTPHPPPPTAPHVGRPANDVPGAHVLMEESVGPHAQGREVRQGDGLGLACDARGGDGLDSAEPCERFPEPTCTPNENHFTPVVPDEKMMLVTS